jgi:hypothetical protein
MYKDEQSQIDDCNTAASAPERPPLTLLRLRAAHSFLDARSAVDELLSNIVPPRHVVGEGAL